MEKPQPGGTALMITVNRYASTNHTLYISHFAKPWTRENGEHQHENPTSIREQGQSIESQSPVLCSTTKRSTNTKHQKVHLRMFIHKFLTLSGQ
ncbi:hypothetical protein V9T40_006669 [Parthenolecanium corni]|uniref:Uncharacterized protein n=1 Tax=Parthenolecanium corni TaxID=536013 RepID=A0AAN9TTY8_9HEMI